MELKERRHWSQWMRKNRPCRKDLVLVGNEVKG